MSAFKCPGCGTVTKLPTRTWKFRKRGHVKTMWCWKCKRKTIHVLL